MLRTSMFRAVLEAKGRTHSLHWRVPAVHPTSSVVTAQTCTTCAAGRPTREKPNPYRGWLTKAAGVNAMATETPAEGTDGGQVDP